MLCHMLSEPSSLNKFQSGAANGFWLIGSEALTAKKTNIAAGKTFSPLIEAFLFFFQKSRGSRGLNPSVVFYLKSQTLHL